MLYFNNNIFHFILTSGGCSSFGHSCFGGHGKRSEDYLSQIRRFQKVSPSTDIIRQLVSYFMYLNVFRIILENIFLLTVINTMFLF